jgi:hypothetical protein
MTCPFARSKSAPSSVFLEFSEECGVMAAKPCRARPVSEIIPVVFAQALNYAALEKRESVISWITAA